MRKKSTSFWNYKRLPKYWQFGHLAAMAIALALVLPAGVAAAPIYFVNHNADALGNTGPNETVGPQDTPIDYSFNGVTYFTGANTGNVQATVNQGTVGISARATNNGGFAPQRQEVVASFTFDTIFGSVGTNPIDVAMNLMISGQILNPPSFVYSTLEVVAGRIGSGISSGGYRESATEPTIQNGMLSGFVADGSQQSISTAVFSVPVNVPVQLLLQLNTIQPYATTSPLIDFANTLTLSTIGDVFTILGGETITVNSVDAGIVNNQFSSAAVVPIPAALPLFAGGLGLLGLLGWRRKRVAAVATQALQHMN